MDAVIDPKNAPKGIQPELVLFDCETCHHPATELRWRRRASTGLGPGALELYDANAVMLRVIAARVAPAAAKVLGEEMLALHHATTESWSAVVRQATLVRAAANELLAALTAHDFTPDDMKALANGVVANGLGGDGGEYSGAEQATMALGSIAPRNEDGRQSRRPAGQGDERRSRRPLQDDRRPRFLPSRSVCRGAESISEDDPAMMAGGCGAVNERSGS